MANQDNLTIGGIGADPSGAYAQIEAGWDHTDSEGVVTMRPTSSSLNIGVEDTGLYAMTLEWDDDITGDGTGAGSNDTVQITGITANAAVSTTTSDCTIEVTTTTGGSADGTTISGSDIISVTAGGLITVTAGLLGSAFDGTINYKENRREAPATRTTEAVNVKGKTGIHIYHPESGDTEVTAKFEYSDGESISIDGVEQMVWADLTTATHSEQAKLLIDPSNDTKWGQLDKMAYIRLNIVITDDGTDGFADAATYEDASDGAYIQFDNPNTLESNKSIVASYSGQATDGSIGGIGADPS